MIIRTYRCEDCQTVFEISCESGNDGDPPCPTCEKVLQWQPSSFNITGAKSKAVDMAQDIMEKDYGLANFKDNNREGDVGYIDPTRKTAAQIDAIGQRESEAGREVVSRMKDITPELKPAVDGFFGGQSVSIGQNRVPVSQMIQAGKQGPAAGIDPMAALHKLGREGKLPKNYNIIARSKLE